MKKYEPELDIDEFIRRSNSLNDMKNCVERMMNEADINDTIVVAKAYPHTDNSGHIEIATHGCKCGIIHIIRQLAKEHNISFIELALEDIFKNMKRKEDDDDEQ